MQNRSVDVPQLEHREPHIGDDVKHERAMKAHDSKRPSTAMRSSALATASITHSTAESDQPRKLSSVATYCAAAQWSGALSISSNSTSMATTATVATQQQPSTRPLASPASAMLIAIVGGFLALLRHDSLATMMGVGGAADNSGTCLSKRDLGIHSNSYESQIIPISSQEFVLILCNS